MFQTPRPPCLSRAYSSSVRSGTFLKSKAGRKLWVCTALPCSIYTLGASSEPAKVHSDRFYQEMRSLPAETAQVNEG